MIGLTQEVYYENNRFCTLCFDPGPIKMKGQTSAAKLTAV